MGFYQSAFDGSPKNAKLSRKPAASAASSSIFAVSVVKTSTALSCFPRSIRPETLKRVVESPRVVHASALCPEVAHLFEGARQAAAAFAGRYSAGGHVVLLKNLWHIEARENALQQAVQEASARG